MGLDIYAGTLTRYYSHNWKTITQQLSEENGQDYKQVDENGNDSAISASDVVISGGDVLIPE